MARKKEAEGGIPEWMCTFGDMMSLLLCFFIMLYSMSIVAERRWQAISDTFTQEFGYQGSSNSKSKKTKTTTTVSDSAARNKRTAALIGGLPTPAPQGESAQVMEILLSGDTVRDGVIIFESGTDLLTAVAEKTLDAILPILRGASQKIMIKGRVSPTEGGGSYRRASDLAYGRAVRVADYLIAQGLRREFFEIVFETGTVPNLALLPPGTDPSQAGASVEIILLHQTPRMLNGNIRDRETGAPTR